jgi:hypothetical protein
MEPVSATGAVAFGAAFMAIAYFVYKLVTKEKDKTARDARNATLPRPKDQTEEEEANSQH